MPAPDTNPDGIPRPTYAATFRCIGPECEDTCCHGWDISVDKFTFQRYQQFRPDNLGQIVSEFISIGGPSAPDPLYATIHRLPSGYCAFFGSDRLCRIQKSYGQDLLSASCSIYPRNLNQVSDILEGTLSLSCPEAARQVLLDPECFIRSGDLHSGEFRTDNRLHLPGGEAGVPALLAARELFLSILRDRSKTIGQRLLQIGGICEDLEKTGQIRRTTLPEAAPLQGSASSAARLDLALKLSAERVGDRSCGPRFSEVYWNLIETIGSAGPASAGDDVQRFLTIEEQYLSPYLTGHPWVLENYLINYILQHLLPFGRTGSPHVATRRPMQEFVLLGIQFAWLQVLLVGAAGAYKDSLSDSHVVTLVQSLTRAVENYPGVLASLLVEAEARGLTSAAPLAALLV